MSPMRTVNCFELFTDLPSVPITVLGTPQALHKYSSFNLGLVCLGVENTATKDLSLEVESHLHQSLAVTPEAT